MIASVVAEIESRLVSAEDIGFFGSVLLAENGRLFVDRGCGEVGGTRIRATSKFWIASIAKSFTSAAVLRCEEQGLLQLSDTLCDCLPEVPREKQQINVRQLLMHQSGFSHAEVSADVVDREEAVASILTEPLAHEPGTHFIYSDANYQLAAAIVETVTAEKFEEFVSRELLSAAGLSRTGFAATLQAGDVVPVPAILPDRMRIRNWGEIGAGGMFSTTQDLFAWYNALRSGELLSPESVENIFSTSVKTPEGWSGLGWFTSVSTEGETIVYTRGSDSMGANGLIYSYPAKDPVVIVLSHAGSTQESTPWSLVLLRTIEDAFRR